MSVSKLFTPQVRMTRPWPVRAEEGSYEFVCPPTHAEIPVFSGPGDQGKDAYPLHLGGGRQSSTPTVAKRPVSAAKNPNY